MNRLNSLTSDVLGSASNIFSQGMQKAQEWTGHIVNYVKQTPEMLAQNPNGSDCPHFLGKYPLLVRHEFSCQQTGLLFSWRE